MIRPIELAGPWLGVYSAAAPNMTPKGYVPYSENIRFKDGRMQSGPSTRLFKELEISAGNILKVDSVLTRNGNTVVIVIGSSKVYGGSLETLSDITPVGWTLGGTPTKVTTTHGIVENAEHYFVMNNKSSGLFSWDCVTIGPMTKYDIEASDLGIKFAEHMTIFSSRLFFANITYPATVSPNQLAWGGSTSLVDLTAIGGAGTLDLTQSDGPLTGLAKISEYLLAFQTKSTSIGSKTGETDLPATFVTLATGVGCISSRTIAELPPSGNALVFQSNLGVAVVTVQGVQILSEPVNNLLDTWTALNETRTQAVNTLGVVVPASKEYWLCFDSGKVLAYNYVTQGWQVYRFYSPDGENPLSFSSVTLGTPLKSALKINQATGKINQAIGKINDYAGTPTTDTPLLLSGTSLYSVDEAPTNRAFVVFPELANVDPFRVSRVIVKMVAKNPMSLYLLATYDNGEKLVGPKLVDIKPLAQNYVSSDINFGRNISRAFWNFVKESVSFQFVMKVLNQPYFEFVGATVYVSSTKDSTMLTPFFGEYSYGVEPEV